MAALTGRHLSARQSKVLPPMQVTVVCQQIMFMCQFNVRVAPQFAEYGGPFDRFDSSGLSLPNRSTRLIALMASLPLLAGTATEATASGLGRDVKGRERVTLVRHRLALAGSVSMTFRAGQQVRQRPAILDDFPRPSGWAYSVTS